MGATKKCRKLSNLPEAFKGSLGNEFETPEEKVESASRVVITHLEGEIVDR